MSISLNVEGYCQNCPHFEAVTDTLLLKSAEEDIYMHTVHCKNSGQCCVIADHIRKYPALYKDFNVPNKN